MSKIQFIDSSTFKIMLNVLHTNRYVYFLTSLKMHFIFKHWHEVEGTHKTVIFKIPNSIQYNQPRERSKKSHSHKMINQLLLRYYPYLKEISYTWNCPPIFFFFFYRFKVLEKKDNTHSEMFIKVIYNSFSFVLSFVFTRPCCCKSRQLWHRSFPLE